MESEYTEQRRVLAEFETDGENLCPECIDISGQTVCGKNHEHVAYLNLSGIVSPDPLGWRQVTLEIEHISISDCIEELCDGCFYWCESLSIVTFRESSSLKLIGKGGILWKRRGRDSYSGRC